MSDKSQWVWMPHAAHLIVGNDCRFHLATWIPLPVTAGMAHGVIVSTVGEWLPDETVREIRAQVRGVQLEGRGDARLADYMQKLGYHEIGCDRLYETMVFAAEPSPGTCCPYRQVGGTELDFAGYNEPEAAYAGHLAMCDKWATQSTERAPA